MTKQKKEKDYIQCVGKCRDIKHKRNFYKSNKSEYDNLNGYCNVCKSCLRELCYSNNKISIDGIHKSLSYLNKPFIWDVYYKFGSDKFDLGNYIKQLNCSQYKNLTYKDSDKDEENNINENENIPKKQEVKENNLNEIEYDFNYLTDKWGIYSNEELIVFEKKYQQLKNNYNEKTAMHTEALLTYIRYRVKEELATASGNVKDAKDWGEMANKAATNAKINPSQLSKADLTEGLSTFSELSLAIEKEVDIIPILPRFKCRPNDALDFNIWCYVNYERDLSGLPPCSYEDIYAFYDQRKRDYVAQYGDPYGIFGDDTSEKNRENIKKFIKEDDDN